MDERIPDCETCAKQFWAALIPKYGDPPCTWCKMPTLEARNYEAWQVFLIAESQMHVVGMGTPLGLMFPAIDRAMDIVGVHPIMRDITFERVRLLGKTYASLLRKQQDDALPKDQKRSRSAAAQPPPMRSPAEQAKFADDPEDGLNDDDDAPPDLLEVPMEEVP